ncbi:hypothetical protein VSR01_17195 [Actinacidiphila sp. DG2A-62]|uniref:hypothetical protein n=1 Tax=Actinacidiphila sp. DG2A-62 TaxID=3108821 RepID=UPI002DBDCFF2|nr:hypothetical protein [Actinacidiphila sp. DG2A-62]MEC3995175.1 hypothetical protein [Actinacidiphila sp. DG2A-62]
MLTELGFVGPAQSDHLYHFTARNGVFANWVPAEIQKMSGPARLNAILRDEQVRAFPPFSVGEAGMPCVCLSESTPEQLAYLIAMMMFGPWGIVTNRAHANSRGGGAVAYVPGPVFDTFRRHDLGHWAMRTEAGSTWLHEREWRIPCRSGRYEIGVLDAILVGNAAWRPSKVVTEWVNVDTGLPVEADQAENPHVVPTREDYPRLWRETPVWAWDRAAGQVVKYEPGELC